ILVNLAEGLSDLHLAEPPAWYENITTRKDFEARFLERVVRSSTHTREMLWYSLDGMPDGLKLKILNYSREHSAFREPSWLVRRAIGSVLSRVDEVHPAKRTSILNLLTAKGWMHECIGLVAARKSRGDAEVILRLTE